MMVSEWISCLDKRPCDRTGEDLDLIYSHLKNFKAFEKFHSSLLQQICYYGYYEDLDRGVTLFRQGDIGTNWYIVLSGSLEVLVSETGNHKDAVNVGVLGEGACFGESILTNRPRYATVSTRELSELVRVEQKDFKLLWESSRHLLEEVITPLEKLSVNTGSPIRFSPSHARTSRHKISSNHRFSIPPNPAAPITTIPSEKLVRAGQVLRTVLLCRAPHMIRDRKYHLRTYRKCMVGTEMVEWLLQQSPIVHSRNQAVGIWQALCEEGLIVHVCREHQFKDKYLFYRFCEDDEGVGTIPNQIQKKECEEELQDNLIMLSQIGPDAVMRMILRKLPQDRTLDDLEIIYEELLHIKALSHLSTSVKRELASVLVFESHAKAGTVLFNQGDEGKSWYIILKGSVNVVIYGKGTVCTLNEGDDFGKLALLNDAPSEIVKYCPSGKGLLYTYINLEDHRFFGRFRAERSSENADLSWAATIVLREDNCHFLRVDKEDFNRILRDVEANTVRLKEHGQDVLVLEKIPTKSQAADGTMQSNYKYSVMAGTPEKMLEHLLETRLDSTKSEETTNDTFLEDFLLTHVIFMPTEKLCSALLSHYDANAIKNGDQETGDYGVTQKRCVIQFVQEWYNLEEDVFQEDANVQAFLEELHCYVDEDCAAFPSLASELTSLETIMPNVKGYPYIEKPKVGKRRISPSVMLTKKMANDLYVDSINKKQPIKANDESLDLFAVMTVVLSELSGQLLNQRIPLPSQTDMVKIYCADHTYSTLRLPMNSSVHTLLQQAREKLGQGSEDLVLCEIKSSGDRVLYKEDDLCVTTGLSLNGLLFISPKKHLDALTPHPEQEGPTMSSSNTLELMSTKEIAYHMTIHDWQLFICVQEYELIYQVLGRSNFQKITANLDLFLRRFNEVQYWVVTEMVLAQNVGKRVQLLRKFIKIAAHCKEYQNLHSFFAIVMGLSNIAVSRLSQTWEKLPGKFKKLFADFETLMDPSRNHRVYRLSVSKLTPPIIPFMPLLMKDLTFTHEGNKTYFEDLVNFEKMHMIAQTMRSVRICRSQRLDLEPPTTTKSSTEVLDYIRNFHVIDNQRVLTHLSYKLEPRRT